MKVYLYNTIAALGLFCHSLYVLKIYGVSQSVKGILGIVAHNCCMLVVKEFGVCFGAIHE